MTKKQKPNKIIQKANKLLQKELRELADEHRQLSEVIERLLDAGWIDYERVADMIATDLLENPYGVKSYDQKPKNN